MPNFSSLTRLDKINQLLKHNAKRSQRRYNKFLDFWDENGSLKDESFRGDMQQALKDATEAKTLQYNLGKEGGREKGWRNFSAWYKNREDDKHNFDELRGPDVDNVGAYFRGMHPDKIIEQVYRKD